jgi:hypothetical protein
VLLLASAVGVIAIVGCAAPRLRLEAESEPPGTSWKRVFDRWTRDGAVVSWQELDTTLVVSATLRSRAFQQAYADRYLTVYQIKDPAERARVARDDLLKTDSGLHFWVRTASHNYKWNELQPDRGRWRITLIDDQGGEQSPDEVSLVIRSEAVETALLGQPSDPYRRTWHLHFPSLPPRRPESPAPRPLTLRFAGPEGKADLVWLVE